MVNGLVREVPDGTSGRHRLACPLASRLCRTQREEVLLERAYAGDGSWAVVAGDVVGEAAGQAAGNALNWAYTLRLPVDGQVYEVQFDDWMYLMDERVMLNRAVMSKFGIRLGEVTLSFYKR